MAFLRIHKLTEKDEIGYFAPRTWDFWRALIVCFCLCCILGHWLEMPYCWLMDRLFGIVADDYAVWTDPWYHPYWVYGFGAVFMTLLIEPLKEQLILHRKTLWGAFLESLVIAILAAMVLELVMGWLINQPGVARERLLHRTGGHDICMGHLPARLRGVLAALPQSRQRRLRPHHHRLRRLRDRLVPGAETLGEVLGGNAARPPSRIPKRQFCAPALHMPAQADTIGRCN